MHNPMVLKKTTKIRKNRALPENMSQESPKVVQKSLKIRSGTINFYLQFETSVLGGLGDRRQGGGPEKGFSMAKWTLVWPSGL